MRSLQTMRPPAALLATLFLGMVSACSSSTVNTSPATFAQSPVAATPVPVAADGTTTAPGPPPVRTGVLGSAQSLGCSSDLDTMETAIEAFFAFNGQYPNSEADLVQGGLISAESKFHDIGPDGTVVPSPSSGCTR